VARFTREIKGARDAWMRNLSTALKAWFAENNYTSDDINGFSAKIGISPREFRAIRHGEYIVKDSGAYQRLFEETGLSEADPSKIPTPEEGEKTVTVRRISMPRAPSQSKKDPQLIIISDNLKEWLRRNGYRTYDRLARELGIKPANLGQLIRAEGYTSPEIFASLFWRTGIPEFDPRLFPPRKHYLPKSDEVMWKPRAWTEEKYQAEKEAWEQREHLSEPSTPDDTSERDESKDLSLAEVPVEKVREEAIPSSPLPQRATVGGLIDSFIGILSQQIGKGIIEMVEESVSQEIQQVAETVFAKHANLEELVEEMVDSVVSKYTQPPSPAAQSRQSLASVHLSELIAEITKRFEDFKDSSREERDQLVSELGSELGDLYAAIVSFTMDGDSRERSLEIERMHQ
jgi:hypothetical protein